MNTGKGRPKKGFRITERMKKPFAAYVAYARKLAVHQADASAPKPNRTKLVEEAERILSPKALDFARSEGGLTAAPTVAAEPKAHAKRRTIAAIQSEICVLIAELGVIAGDAAPHRL